MSIQQTVASPVGRLEPIEAPDGLNRVHLSRRAARRLGWTVFGLSVGCAATGMFLFETSGSVAARGHGGHFAMMLVFPIFAGVGALILSRQPENALGWLLTFQGFTASLATNGLGYGYVHYALFGSTAGWPAGNWVAWPTDIINAAAFTCAPLLLLLFPTGRAPSRRWQPLVWITLVVAVGAAVSTALKGGPLAVFPDLSNPTGLSGSGGDIALVVWNGGQVLGVLLWLAAVGSVFARLRAARGVERLQLKWFAYAAALIAAGVILALGSTVWLPAFGVDPTQPPTWLAFLLNEVLWPTAVAGIPISIGVAMLRHRLYDIDLLINRTIVYGALIAAIVGIYVLVVGYVGLLFQARGDFASLVAAGLAAVLFQPLRSRLQVGVNRLLYGRRDEPYGVLSLLGRRLETVLESDALMSAIVETVRDALRVPYVALGVRSPDGERIAAASGTPAPVALQVALPYQSESIGSLLVAARRPGESLSAADQQLLEDVARQAGAAVHAVALTAELQRARERLVAAREEERRRLRRDLHDGLGPRLASLGLQLAALRNTLGQQPALEARVGAVKEQMQEAVEDVRRLVDGLRPPALDELGLIGALQQHAAWYAEQSSGVQVLVEAPDGLPALPAAVEVAAYRIVSEALTNCVRHAHARTCTVQLRACQPDLDSVLELEIIDDGSGLQPNRRMGTGLVSMRERAEELGGTCTVTARPQGGTRVLARLPIAAAGR
ncbi:MAG TPA: sensor histidine kinase [Chloroflexota bacterium]|nr:sensor histidine kinase [Chloroflexota bacterium]